MEIKNTTKFSKEGYFTLNKAISKKLIYICIIFEIALAILMVSLIIKEKDFIKPLVLGILMIAYPFILTLMMKGQLKRNYNLNKNVYEKMIYDFLFVDNQINVRLTSDDQVNDGHIAYRAIYRAIETPKFLFIFISSNQAYIVEKNNFNSPEELEMVISKIKSENIKYKFMNINVKVD